MITIYPLFQCALVSISQQGGRVGFTAPSPHIFEAAPQPHIIIIFSLGTAISVCVCIYACSTELEHISPPLLSSGDMAVF